MTERKYPIKNRVSGKTLYVPLREYKEYMGAIEGATGKPYFEALSDVPGIAYGHDGDMQQTLVPKERVQEAIGGKSNLAILRSDDDPLVEAARKSAVRSAKREVAKNRSGAAVAADSFLSGVTFGGASKLANSLAGEGAEEARGLQIDEHAGAHFGGRAASLLMLGMLPIPGLGKVTVGASKGLKAGTIFELGGKASSLARGAVKGKGFGSELARRIAGPVSFGLVADAPLAAAMVAADIVDNDKELTGDAIASEFFTQYAFAVGIAAATSLPFAFLGSALNKAGTAAVKKGNAVFSQNDLIKSIGSGLGRHQFRPLRSKFGGAVDVAESAYYKVWGKLTKGHPGRVPSETRIGQMLAGGHADDWVNLRMTNRQAIEGLHTAVTGGQLRKNIDILRRNIRDPDLDAPLAFIRENADELITARRKAQSLIADGRGLAERFLAQEYKHPIGATFADGTDKIINKGLQLANLKPITSGKYPERLAKALNMRKGLERGSPEIVALDKELAKAVDGIGKHLSWIDKAEQSAHEVIRMSDDFGKAGTRLFDEVDLLDGKGFRATVRGIDGPVRGLSDDAAKIIKRDPFLSGESPPYIMDGKAMKSTIDSRLDDLSDGLASMSKANNAAQGLLDDARPLITAAKPMTQEQMLAAQVESVMSSKERVTQTLSYIARKSGGARHTAAFGGVYLFREMGSIEEKRAAFRMFHDSIRENATNIEATAIRAGELVDSAAAFDMDLGVAMAGTQIAAIAYLNQQLPYSSDSMVGPEHMSMAEIENFFEAVGAIMDPISALATAVDGSTTGQSVDAISSVYPKLYTEMVLDVAEFVQEHGDILGHDQLIGLDTFTGYALGYSDGPGPELTMQPPYSQTPEQSRAIGGPENRRMNIQQNATPAQKVGAL